MPSPALPRSGSSALHLEAATGPVRGHREVDRRARRRQGQGWDERADNAGGRGHDPRTAGQSAVGHASDRGHRHRLVRQEPGPRASGSASSTPASTAITPTSRPTSTGAEPELRRRHARHRRPLRGCRPVSTRPTWTRTTTAPTSPARSARRSTGSASPGSRRNVTLINIRAGQDSGYFFLRATLEAMIYAGDIGIDVINMSYYTDPWLYNCVEQSGRLARRAGRSSGVVRQATQRALNYARHRGVLPIAAMGNGATDSATRPSTTRAPTTRPARSRERDIDNSCITVPTEARGVVVGELARPEHPQGLLLRLRHRADRRVRARAATSTTRPTTPGTRQPGPRRLPAGAGPGAATN